MIVVMLVLIPVVLSFPAMIFAVPPLMVGAPATFPLGVQIAPPFFGFAAVFAFIVDCAVQSCFRLFDGMLTFFFFVCMHKGCCDE